MSKCTMPACLDPVHKRGLCLRHWDHFFGNPDNPTPRKPAIHPDVIEAITWGAAASPLLAYRTRRGWTQAFLAQVMDTTAKNISVWETSGAPAYIVLAIYGLEELENAASEGRLNSITQRLFERMKPVP